MEYAEAIADSKRRLTKIKALLENPNMSSRSAPQAVNDAKMRLNRMQLELATMEKTLQQFVGQPRPPVKMGPSETK